MSGYRLADARPARRTRHRHRGRHPAAVLGRARARQQYLQLDDVVTTARSVPGIGEVTHVRRGHPGRRPARGRQLRLRRVPDRRRRAARPRAGDRRGHHHPRRAGVLRAAAARARRSAGPPARSATRRCTSTRWTARCRSGSAATASRSTSTSSSSTAPAARTSRSAASPASRRRPASRCSCCYSLFQLGRARRRGGQRQGAGVQREGRGPAVPRPRATPRSTTTSTARDYAELGLPAGAVRVGRASTPRRRPDDPTRPPDVTGRTSGRHRVLVDARRVLRRRAAALRVRRRRGRAQPVHDGRPPRWPPGCARDGHAGRRRRGRRSTGTILRTYDDLVDVRRPTGSATTTPAATGRARSPAPARSTRSSAGCARRCKPLRAHRSAATCRDTPSARVDHRGPAGHGRRPAQPPRARPALRRRRRARGRDRAQGGGRAGRRCCSR